MNLNLDKDLQYKNLLKDKPKQNDNIEHDKGCDQTSAQSFTPWSFEDRLVFDRSLVPFSNLVIDNINSLVTCKDTQSTSNGEASPKVICDIGCGSGEVMDYLIQRIKSDLSNELFFHGFDNSLSMINIAKKQYTQDSSRHNVRCYFSVEDMHNLLKVPDNSVDFMYSCYVFQHSQKPKYLFNHLSTKLKDGAKFIFLTSMVEPKDKSKDFPSEYLSNNCIPIKLPNDVVCGQWHTMTEWCSALEESGFAWSVVSNVSICIYKDDIDVREVIIDATYIEI